MYACCLSLPAEETSILLFGHSFGVDSTEHLPALLDAAGVRTVHLGRFVKANCSLEEHYNFFAADALNSNYTYYECSPGSTTWQTRGLTVKEVVSERAWDYVIFQNSLENEGRYETAQPYLNDLVAYVRSRSRELFAREPVICWNMFWPISKLAEDGSNSTLAYRLSFYGNSSANMWEAYRRATRELMADTGIINVVPTGTAIMNLRASSLNTAAMNEFTRDKYHLSEGAGRYAAACTLFEYFVRPRCGVGVLGNSLRLPGLSQPVTDANAAIIQQCAADAVALPFGIAPDGRSWIRDSAAAKETTGFWKPAAEYGNGSVAVDGMNVFVPALPSDGRFVKITTTLRFDEEWTDIDYSGDAKAAVRLAPGGRLQAYTRVNGEKAWVDATGASLETNRDYTVVLTLDCQSRTYAVTLDDGAVRRRLRNGDGDSFAFATDDASPVGKLRFEGKGAVTSIFGRYWNTVIGGLFLLLR
ncbi:MAG: DUF4886 domain-containing protein [Kiritimatiellae bacterium]|nr:DUF4886 domain-containing protein [Kiritimatiellia bacterium]